jgi:hypothetical protein
VSRVIESGGVLEIEPVRTVLEEVERIARR